MKTDLDQIDDMMSPEDYKAIEAVARIKRHMTTFFDKKKLVAEMVRIIDDAKCFAFSSDRAKKFIDHVRPVFKTHFSHDVAVTEFEGMFTYDLSSGIHLKLKKDLTLREERDLVDSRMNIIHRELIAPFSEVMRRELKDSDSELLLESPTDKELAACVLSSIFHVKVDLEPDNPLCYLEYTL